MKVFYHDDNDGKCAAHQVYLYTKLNNVDINKKDFYPVNYNDKTPDASLIEKGEEVYIVDYSFTEATIDKLLAISFKANGNVHWFDHHKSSLEVLDYVTSTNICKSVCIDMERSGALIAYNMLIKGTNSDDGCVRHVVDLVDDHDRWIHAIPESKLFNLGSIVFPNGPCDNIWHSDPDNVIDKGVSISEYTNIANLKACRQGKYLIKINDKRCVVLNTPIKSSEALSTYFEKYGLAIRWSFNGQNFEYSVYSTLEDVDCSAIAKHFNPAGGGHKGAAGFTSDKLLFKDGFTFRIKGATIND